VTRAVELKAKRRVEKRTYIYNYLLTHPCVRCWEDRPVCLEFHHIEPDIKSFDLWMRISKDRSMFSINQEIEKCIVLCANCHKVVTAKEQGRYNFLNVGTE
jgi:hypothetical protein